jgi:S-adenosylmethionine/arginine decarboxylase-like enzyme
MLKSRHPKPFEPQRLIPGQLVHVSGQYTNNRTHKQVTLVRGETCPPGPKRSHFDLTDPTRHKND